MIMISSLYPSNQAETKKCMRSPRGSPARPTAGGGDGRGPCRRVAAEARSGSTRAQVMSGAKGPPVGRAPAAPLTPQSAYCVPSGAPGSPSRSAPAGSPSLVLPPECRHRADLRPAHPSGPSGFGGEGLGGPNMALRPPLWRQCAKCSERSSFSFHAPRLSGWEAGKEDQRRIARRTPTRGVRARARCACT